MFGGSGYLECKFRSGLELKYEEVLILEKGDKGGGSV